MVIIKNYKKQHHDDLLQFLEVCLPQSGRRFELDGRHKMYDKIEEYFEVFWCLFDEEHIIGTVALKRLSDERCELKALYLLQQYHKNGLGYRLLKTAIECSCTVKKQATENKR